MIELVSLTTAQTKVLGQQSNNLKKDRKKDRIPYPPPPTHIASSVQLSTCKKLGNVWFLQFFVNSLKKFFEQTHIQLF